MKMLKETPAPKLGAFLTSEFSRVSPAIAGQVCEAAGASAATWVASVTPPQAEKLYNALQAVRLRAPSTNCLAPIGAEAILAGLLKGVKAEFYTASTRPPAVYRGNPFQIEVGLAYGGELGADARDVGVRTARATTTPCKRGSFASPTGCRCSINRAVVRPSKRSWTRVGASTGCRNRPGPCRGRRWWSSFTWRAFGCRSFLRGKEAIADYDEIRKEVKLALSECGRRLHTLLRRKRTKAHYSKRRDVFTRYIEEVVEAAGAIALINKSDFRSDLQALSRTYTEAADMEFDDHGKVIKKKVVQNELGLADTIVVERAGTGETEELFSTRPTEGKPRGPSKAKKRRKR